MKISKKMWKVWERKLQDQLSKIGPEIVLDEYYDFKRAKGYKPTGFIRAEDEILDLCKKQRILVSSIVKYEGYQVVGKKIRTKKAFEKAYELLKLNK